MNEAQGGRGQNWGRREFYEVIIEMSRVASEKQLENAVVSSGQLPNEIVRRWPGELHKEQRPICQGIIGMLHFQNRSGLGGGCFQLECQFSL